MSEAYENAMKLVAMTGIAMVSLSVGIGLFGAVCFAGYKIVAEITKERKWRSDK